MRSSQYIGGKIAVKGLDQIDLEDMTSMNPRLDIHFSTTQLRSTRN